MIYERRMIAMRDPKMSRISRDHHWLSCSVLAALFYLGGLVSQAYLGYQQWQADGGLAGDAIMAPVLFSPLECWRSALTANGLICTLLLALLAGGLYALSPAPRPFQEQGL